MIANDVDANQLMFVSSYDVIGDDFFRALPPVGIRGCRLSLSGVIDGGIEISLALQTFAHVALAFFKKIGVDSAFLIYRQEPFQITFRKFRTHYLKFHAGAL